MSIVNSMSLTQKHWFSCISLGWRFLKLFFKLIKRQKKKKKNENLHLNKNKAVTEALQSPRHWCIKDTKQLYVQFPENYSSNTSPGLQRAGTIPTKKIKK